MRNAAFVLVSLSLASLFVAGCGPKEVTTLKANEPAPALQQGWRQRQAQGFSVQSPDNYRVPEGAVDSADIANLSNPGVSYGFAPANQSATATALLILADRGIKPIPGEPTTGMNVNYKKIGGGTSLKAEADFHAKGYVNVTSRQTWQHPLGPIEEIIARTGTAGGDKISHIDYVLVNKEDVYIVRFTTANDISTIQQMARPIMETFRLTPGVAAVPADISPEETTIRDLSEQMGGMLGDGE